MARQWTPEGIRQTGWSFRPAAILTTAAELDIFSKITQPMTAREIADVVQADLRGITILADALVCLELLEKSDDKYTLAPGVDELLTEQSPKNLLASVRHLANCMRRWVQLSRVTKTGLPAYRTPSIRGEQADLEAFIQAMNDFSVPVADEVVARLKGVQFAHLLDVGGASGTWTLALLRAFPEAKATIFDLPEVVPMARARIAETEFADRIDFAPGDYLQDDLPGGADFVWLSAITHQHSREKCRLIYKKIHSALTPGGTMTIRDIVMDPDHTSPPAGALFAVNMLANTEGGSTYTLDEYKEDLEESGFQNVRLLHSDPWMNCLVTAVKPR